MHITAGCWLSLGIHCASISCNHCSYTWSIPCRVQDPRSYKKQKWFYQLYNTRVSCNATVYVHFPFHRSIPVIRDAHYLEALATYKFLCSTKWLTAAVDLQDYKAHELETVPCLDTEAWQLPYLLIKLVQWDNSPRDTLGSSTCTEHRKS